MSPSNIDYFLLNYKLFKHKILKIPLSYFL